MINYPKEEVDTRTFIEWATKKLIPWLAKINVVVLICTPGSKTLLVIGCSAVFWLCIFWTMLLVYEEKKAL